MIASDSPTKGRDLHQLLDGLTAAHRRDIHDYSGGHLNQANLAKPSGQNGHKTWKSANKSTVKRQTTKPSKGDPKDGKMRNTLASFSVGTSGSLPIGNTNHPGQRMGTRAPVVVPRKPSAGEYTKTDDGVLVEEIRQGEILLSNSRYARPKAWVEEDFKDDDNFDLSAVSQSLIKDRNLAKLEHTIVLSYKSGITKTDQYGSFKAFESKVIRKQDALEQNILSGVKAVEHLENKLQQGLDQLQYHGYGPNFHRLQLYSDIFDELNDQSATFGFILRTIKKEYDDYVASLLDSQGNKHKVLYDQVESMRQRQGGNTRILNREKAAVDGMESNTKNLIDENERLRKELLDELELASQPMPEVTDAKNTLYVTDPPPELTDQIEELHATILEKLDQINDLRATLRRDFVPSTVVTHLEQCIKETEVELQKLKSQKEYFDRSIGDMESELEKHIEEADTTERDSRRVWKRINAVKKMSKKADDDDNDDDNDEDDEVKWNWYIS